MEGCSVFVLTLPLFASNTDIKKLSLLKLYFSGLGKVKFEFTGQSNIVQIEQIISTYILR